LWVSNIELWLRSQRSPAELAEELAGRNLEVHEICFAQVLKQDGTLADARRVFEWAKELGAPAVISLYFRPDNPLQKARDDWAAFVRSVEDIGVAAAFEFIGMWPNYNSPLSAWQVIRDGPALGRMVFDTFHFWRGGCDLSQIEKVPGERISLVHLNDVKDVPRDRAVDADRTYPGEGIMPLGQIVGGLVRGGFRGPFSVEIFGEVQEQEPGVCKRAYRAARNVVGAA